MSFIRNSKEFAMQALSTANQKKDEIVTVQKLKYKIYKLERKLNVLYAALGKNEYKTVKGAGNNQDLKKIICKDIDNLLEELENVNYQLSDAKNTFACPSCGYYNKKDAIYCSGCGEQLNNECEECVENEEN